MIIFNELVALGVLNMHVKDDWEKPRSTTQHLTKEEIQRMRVAFNCGRKPRDIARELQCSTRVAMTYYAKFRNGTFERRAPKMAEIEPSAPKSRLY